jgi:hypothetical protein
MISLEETKKELKSEYNDAISIYHYTGHLRFTNGSAGMFLNIKTNDDEFVIVGRRYGERIYKRCDRSIDALIETLRSTI